jgi:hypothetical protein
VDQEDVVVQSIIEEEISNFKDFVTIKEIIQISGRLNEPVIDIVKHLQRFIPLGINLQAVDLDLVKNLTVTREDLIAFSHSN